MCNKNLPLAFDFMLPAPPQLVGMFGQIFTGKLIMDMSDFELFDRKLGG